MDFINLKELINMKLIKKKIFKNKKKFLLISIFILFVLSFVFFPESGPPIYAEDDYNESENGNGELKASSTDNNLTRVGYPLVLRQSADESCLRGDLI